MLSKILAGVDEKPGARDAAALGDVLAAAAGADLLLVCAYADPLLPFPLTVGRDVHRVRDAQQRLADVRPVDAPHAHTRTVPDFSAARALRRAVRDEHADLLVLGPSRDAPEGVARAGKTGRQVLHDAPCAVAFAVAGLHEQRRPLSRIVVGIDATPESHAALALARDLASACGAQITAVSVADDRLPVEAMPLGTIAGMSEWDEILELRRTHLRAHLDELLAGTVNVTPEVAIGDPAEELSARATGADLLIIGSRRWGTIERVAVGSTADELCRSAPCSILVVPRPAQEPLPGAADSAHAAPPVGR